MKKLLPIFAIAAVMMACNNSANTEEQVRLAKQATIDSINRVETAKQLEEASRQHIIDSMNSVASQMHPRVIERTTVVKQESGSGNADYAATPASTTTTTTKKKGWTGATKGAVIGAGAGAITGALTDKRKGEGAIVGGLLGAGAGAATGAIIDKEKKKKAAREAEENK